MEETEMNIIKNANKLMNKEKEQIVYFILNQEQIESSWSTEQISYLKLESSKLKHHSQYFRDTLSKTIETLFYFDS